MTEPRSNSGGWHIPLFIVVLAIDGMFFKFEGTKRGLLFVGSFIAEETFWGGLFDKLLGID